MKVRHIKRRRCYRCIVTPMQRHLRSGPSVLTEALMESIIIGMGAYYVKMLAEDVIYPGKPSVTK